MQQLEHLRRNLPFFKTLGRESLRRGEDIEGPETRMSIDLRHDLEQLLEARGKNIISFLEVVRQLVVPIGILTCAINRISPMSLVRQRELETEIKDDDKSVEVYIKSFGANPEESKWIIMDVEVPDKKSTLGFQRTLVEKYDIHN